MDTVYIRKDKELELLLREQTIIDLHMWYQAVKDCHTLNICDSWAYGHWKYVK